MDSRTSFDNLDETIQVAIESAMAELHTAIPCKVVSVDFSKQTCVLQPTVKSRIRKEDGTAGWLDMPQIPDVPLHFPTGGGVTMTFPVKEGDEALAIISSRSKDTWQQQGGEQQQIDLRTHDLSNAFAMVGFKSQPAALENVSSSSTQIRSADGKQVIDLHPSNGLKFTSEGVSLAIGKDGVDIAGGYLKVNGVRVDETHVHTGVDPGSGTSGPPEA